MNNFIKYIILGACLFGTAILSISSSAAVVVRHGAAGGGVGVRHVRVVRHPAARVATRRAVVGAPVVRPYRRTAIRARARY